MTSPNPNVDEENLSGSSAWVRMQDMDTVSATKTQTSCPQTHRAPSVKDDIGFRGC